MKDFTDQQKQKMQEYYKKLITADREEIRVKYDKAIHYLLVQASKNDYMISNYKALNNIMDRYIPTMRQDGVQGAQGHLRDLQGRRHRPAPDLRSRACDAAAPARPRTRHAHAARGWHAQGRLGHDFALGGPARHDG